MSTAFCSVGNMAPNNQGKYEERFAVFSAGFFFFQGERIGET